MAARLTVPIARLCLTCVPALGLRQAIAEAVQSAVAAKQQVVEPDHLAKALLEQPNGLARRIVVKVQLCVLTASYRATQHPAADHGPGELPRVKPLAPVQIRGCVPSACLRVERCDPSAVPS